jgi:hypothetical protein
MLINIGYLQTHHNVLHPISPSSILSDVIFKHTISIVQFSISILIRLKSLEDFALIPSYHAKKEKKTTTNKQTKILASTIQN